MKIILNYLHKTISVICSSLDWIFQLSDSPKANFIWILWELNVILTKFREVEGFRISWLPCSWNVCYYCYLVYMRRLCEYLNKVINFRDGQLFDTSIRRYRMELNLDSERRDRGQKWLCICIGLFDVSGHLDQFWRYLFVSQNL